mmetsp:Transcript_28426/g.27386  ORF Transcript_28426/g.27386 Transcript_28426/m.27386 type:complete len:251 (-) Transcript_28426:890-1642(-)
MGEVELAQVPALHDDEVGGSIYAFNEPVSDVDNFLGDHKVQVALVPISGHDQGNLLALAVSEDVGEVPFQLHVPVLVSLLDIVELVPQLLDLGRIKQIDVPVVQNDEDVHAVFMLDDLDEPFDLRARETDVLRPGVRAHVEAREVVLMRNHSKGLLLGDDLEVLEDPHHVLGVLILDLVEPKLLRSNLLRHLPVQHPVLLMVDLVVGVLSLVVNELEVEGFKGEAHLQGRNVEPVRGELLLIVPVQIEEP